jgi:hypothetical protein
MEQVREFLASQGADTTPDKRAERLQARSPA